MRFSPPETARWKSSPRRREDHGTGAAFEQPGPDLVFESGDVAADGGLVDPQLLGGGAEAHMACGGFERPQGVRAGQRSVGNSQHLEIGILSMMFTASVGRDAFVPLAWHPVRT